jgi:membrane fusion protein (multidrug efflux system)
MLFKVDFMIRPEEILVLLRKHFFLMGAAAALILMVVAGGLMLVANSAVKAKKAMGAGAAGRTVAVASAVISPQDFTDRIEALGVAKARQSVTVTSNTAELITKVLFHDGQSVSKGQVLVELKGDEQDAAVAQAQSLAAQARLDAARWSDLAAKGYSPRVTAERYQAASVQADASLKAAQSRRLNRVIRAPFSGVVGLSDVAPGALIAAGGPIVSLDDLAVVRIDFPVPDRFYARLHKGMSLTAKVDAYPDAQFKGAVAQVDTRIDERTRSVRARAEFANSDGRLRPGMLAKVVVEEGVRSALAAPEAAVQFEGEQAFVFTIVKDDGKSDGPRAGQRAGKRKKMLEGMAANAPKGPKMIAHRQTIVVGARQNGFIEVTSGLRAGETIVADGMNRVQPNQAVRVGKPDGAGVAGSGKGHRPGGPNGMPGAGGKWSKGAAE